MIKECRSLSDLFLNKRTLLQFKRYLITGFLSAAVEYSVLFVLTDFIGLWHIFSNTVAIAASFCFNFLMNKYWSFKSKQDIKKQLLQYGLLFAVNMCLSNIIIYLMSDVLNMYYLIPKLASTVIITFWNFIIYKKIIYK